MTKHDGTRASQEAPYRYDFRSLTLDAPKYLQWLATQLQDASLPGPPGTIARISSVYTLQSAAALVPKASVLVNATGLGLSLIHI